MVTVVSATGIKKGWWVTKPSPYAVVVLNQRDIGRTRVLSKTLNPVWNEPKESFSVRARGNKDACSVVVQLWDAVGGNAWFCF